VRPTDEANQRTSRSLSTTSALLIGQFVALVGVLGPCQALSTAVHSPLAIPRSVTFRPSKEERKEKDYPSAQAPRVCIRDIRLELSGATASDIADAEAALSRLRTGGQAVPGLESLTHSLLRSEAVASSWIEALRVSHRKLAEAGAQAPGGRYDDARAVLGNVQAMAAAVRTGAASEPFSVDDILSMHGMLLSASDVPEDRMRAGRFRDEPVFVGGTNPTNAEYVGPPTRSRSSSPTSSRSSTSATIWRRPSSRGSRMRSSRASTRSTTATGGWDAASSTRCCGGRPPTTSSRRFPSPSPATAIGTSRG
jgi:hypothetical protein